MLVNIYMHCMMRDVPHRCPRLGIRLHYRMDGWWVEAADMACEQRSASLMYADDSVLLASSERDLQHLFDEPHEVSTRDGMRIGK